MGIDKTNLVPKLGSFGVFASEEEIVKQCIPVCSYRYSITVKGKIAQFLKIFQVFLGYRTTCFIE